MKETVHSLFSLIQRHSPYPPAVQVVAMLVLAATPLSTSDMLREAPTAFWQLTLLMGLYFLAVMLIPARRLPLWGQLAYLLVQCAFTAFAGTILHAPLLDYIFLVIVLQAIALFRPWLWIPFAVAVLLLWNSLVLLGAVNLWAWLQSNLALAFPATCVIIAAIVYTRQLRRNEQVQHALQQMQQHYDSLASGMRDLQQHVMLEERRRLTQTIADEMQAVLARAEQSVAQAIGQTQSNLARLRTTVEQTRHSASTAVERLRNAISTLRGAEPPTQYGPHASLARISGSSDELVLGAISARVLSWVLPMVFVLLALALTALQHHLSSEILLPVITFGGLLWITAIFTQSVRHPLLLQAALAGQALAVLMMALLTQTLPLLLGLLLVLWQAAIRLSPGQALMFIIGAPTSLGVLVSQLRPTLFGAAEVLLPYAVSAMAVTIPLLLARRQQSRRRQAELQLALLTAEIEQQTGEVRQLAVMAERNRLAREFHDDLGSRLMLINLQLQIAEELADEQADEALAKLQSSREQLHAAWRSVIAVADADLPISVGELPGALEELVLRARGLAPATISLSLEGALDMPPEVACTLYRTIQEGLSNAQKHARPTRIDVRVIAESGYITVTIENDDSDGAPHVLPTIASGSFGLIGLRERAEMLGGGVEAGPRTEGGWRLRLVLPAEAHHGGDYC